MRRNPRYSVQQSTEGGRVCWRIFDGSSDTGKYFFTESGARNRMGMLPGYDGSSAPAPTQVQTPTPSFVPPIPPRAPAPTPTVEVERDMRDYSPISRGPRLEGAQRKGHIKVAPTDLSRPVTISIRGQEYTVKETSRKRSQDLRRFEVWKPGQATPYVITFQNPNGSIAACSCPNAIYRQQGCKHIEGVIKAIREVSMARYNGHLGGRKPVLRKIKTSGGQPALQKAGKSRLGLKPLSTSVDVYDPREEAVRAVARGKDWPIAVGHYKKTHSVPQIVQRSWERYQDVDHLIRGRQEYEYGLGVGAHRNYGPYRVTCEPTLNGLTYFVWPLPPGQHRPQSYRTEEQALAAVQRLNEEHIRPYPTLRERSYSRTELLSWLPPEQVFKERDGIPSGTAQREAKKANR